MDVSELFPSKYLKAADATPALALTIARVVWEKMKDKDGNEEDKPVMFFYEQEKGMVLNRTNANTVTHLYGSDVDKWTGQRVVLGTEVVTAFGESKPALRFKNEEAKSADPVVQAFWNMIADMRMTREEGLAHLKEFKGNFTKALAGLVGDDTAPVAQPAEDMPF